MPSCHYCKSEIPQEEAGDEVRYTPTNKKEGLLKSRYYFVCKNCSPTGTMPKAYLLLLCVVVGTLLIALAVESIFLQ